MKRLPILARVLPLILVTLACNTFARPVAVATAIATPPPASPVPTLPPTLPPTAAPTVTPQPSPLPTDTALPAPTGAATGPALPSMNPTTLAMLGPLADLMNISQYFNPVGTPLTTWNGVPIMPEATAGQAYNANIYSFKANATIPEAVKFYRAPAQALGILAGPGTGSAGTGSQAVHNAVYLGYQSAIAIYAYDSNPQVVMVVIDKAP